MSSCETWVLLLQDASTHTKQLLLMQGLPGCVCVACAPKLIAS